MRKQWIREQMPTIFSLYIFGRAFRADLRFGVGRTKTFYTSRLICVSRVLAL